MCPNGDRDLDDESAAKTFVMSNMVPQAAALNQQSWKNLEIHCQNLARKGKELYIICGPHGRGGQGEVIKRKKIDGKFKIIEKRIVFETGIGKDERITVPAHCWKVILILEGGEGDPLERVTEMSEVIAVIMANDTTPKKWRDHRVTIAEVEKLTRFKFLSNVKEEVRKALLKRGPEDTGRLESAPRWFARGAFDVFLFHAASRVNGRAL
jgi:endonuclease G